MSSEQYEKIAKVKKKNPLVVWITLVAVCFGALFVLAQLYELERPQLTLLTDVSLMGRNAQIEISVTDEKSGIQSLELVLLQGNKKVKLLDKQFSRQGLFGTEPGKLDQVIEVDASALGLIDGRADLIVKASDFSFWRWMAGNETKESFLVVFDTQPPKLRIVDSPVAMKPGSSGVIVYRANEEIADHGVTINGDFHPGFPVNSNDDMFVAVIGIRYDTETITGASVTAYDRAGNAGGMAFGLNLRKVKKKTDRINVNKRFLDRKLPEFLQYYPDISGDPLDQYIYINNEIRAENASRIKEICLKPNRERQWSGPFKRMRRSSRRAGFADYRSYYHNGRKIDSQVHLGIDLASVRQAPVEAANAGTVIFADYLGIYGNMVVVDHGQGVFSLYSHLSKIAVGVGDLVGKAAVLGNTGVSGMAGGDHLHFSMLVNGIFVDPLEWWDKGWLQLHITNYLK